MDSFGSLFLYVIPLIIQAALFDLTLSIKTKNGKITTRNKPKGDQDEKQEQENNQRIVGDGDQDQVEVIADLVTIRTIRLILLPVTLSLLLYSLMNLKYHAISPGVRINLGCTLLTQVFRSLILTLDEFSLSSSSTQDNIHPTPDRQLASRTIPRIIFDILVLAFMGRPVSIPSTDLSMKPSKVDHSLGSDIRFLVKMIVRIGHLQSLATIGLTFWKDVHRFDPSTIDDHRLAGRSGWMRWVKPYEGEIMTFCWGLLVWTMLDISGSLINLMSIMAKLINRLILYLFESSRKNSLQVTLDRIDFNQLKPYFRSPYRANSLTRFWNGHWHDFLREIFIHAGMVPVTFFLVRYLGLQPNSKVVRLGGILGAFSVSGAVHEFGFWSAGPIDPTFRSFRFFFFQGVGVCLEQGFRTLTGRRVDGLIGKIWTFSWLIFFGKPMVRVAMKTLSLEPDKLFEKIDEIGLLGLILRPLSLFKLFEAL